MQTGQRIAKLRTRAGLSQAQLADALFVSRELVSKWETGSNRPDRKMLEALAKMFSVPLSCSVSGHGILLFASADRFARLTAPDNAEWYYYLAQQNSGDTVRE